MTDLERVLIECAGAKDCFGCEAYPGCTGVSQIMLEAAEEIGRLRTAEKDAWKPAGEPPKDERFVLVRVSGRYKNIRFQDVVTTGAYYGEEGWELEAWPEWEKPGVTQWRELPE